MRTRWTDVCVPLFVRPCGLCSVLHWCLQVGPCGFVFCVTLVSSGWSLWLRVLCYTGAFRLVPMASCSALHWYLQVGPCGFVFCVTLVPSGWSLWLRVLRYTGAFRFVPVASCSALHWCLQVGPCGFVFYVLHWCLQVGPYGFAFCVTLVPSGSSGAFFAGGFSVTVPNAVLGVCGIYSPAVTAHLRPLMFSHANTCARARTHTHTHAHTHRESVRGITINTNYFACTVLILMYKLQHY